MGDVKFYYVPRAWRVFQEVSLVNNPAIDDLDEGICFSDFDKIIVSALGCKAARNENVERGMHPLARMTCANWGRGLGLPLGIQVVSEDVFKLALEEWIIDQRIVRLATDISRYYFGKLIFQPWPAPNRALAEDSNWIINRWYGNNGPSVWFNYWKAQYGAIVKISKERAQNALLLEYPLPGPAHDGFMDGHLCDRDPFHGNHNYGELVVNQILELG